MKGSGCAGTASASLGGDGRRDEAALLVEAAGPVLVGVGVARAQRLDLEVAHPVAAKLALGPVEQVRFGIAGHRFVSDSPAEATRQTADESLVVTGG